MPSPSSALQRPDLGQTFEEFDLEASRQGFIADRVLPAMDVAETSANVGKVPLEALLSERDTARTNGGAYARQNYKFETFSYATEEHGAEEAVDDRQAKVHRRYIDAEMISARRALDVVLRNRERRVADAVFNATTWTGAALFTSISNEWDDSANATPVDDIDAAIEKVFTGSGLIPNVLIVNHYVLRNLRKCDQVVDRVKYAGFDDPKLPVATIAKVLAELFGVEEVLVSGAPRNSAKLGQAASISRIWSNEYAMVARVARSMDMREPCIGRTFHFIEDGSELDGRVESYRDETVRSNIVRVRHDTDEVIMYAAAAHLLGNITT